MCFITQSNKSDKNINLTRNPETLVAGEAGILVVIDPRVEAPQILAAGISPRAAVLMLDPNRDGVEQITQALADHASTSLYILCHGTPGTLYLGKTPLSLANLDRYTYHLQEWGVTEILFYSCNVAAGDAGAEFIERLYQLTKANIAAATQRVGSVAQGGSWHLDYQLGQIDPDLAVLPGLQDAYPGVFAISEFFDGTFSDDKLYGGKGNDLIRGSEGNDLLYGEAGDDTLKGGEGNDTVEGGEGKDLIYGWRGDDSLFGGANDDEMHGGRGQDQLYGGKGDDAIGGGADNDIINGGAGNDIIFGDNYIAGTANIPGTGNLDSNLVVNGSFEDNSVKPGKWSVFQSIPGWTTIVGPGIEIQELSNNFGAAADGQTWVELDSHKGSDTNSGMRQDIDTTAGETYQLSFAYSPRSGISAASNIIEVYWNSKLLDTITDEGGSSNDWTTYTYEVEANNGNSTALEFRAAGISDRLGGFIDDVKVQRVNEEMIALGNGTVSGDDQMHGEDSEDNDQILGGDGDDHIFGGKGDDILNGGTGKDYIWGGVGHDLFVLNQGQGKDIIADYDIQQDAIGLTDGLALEQLDITQSHDDTVIKFGNDVLAFLTDVNADQLIAQGTFQSFAMI